MTHQDKAEALFEQGFNCAQAVFAAFAQDYGMDEKTALLTASSLGGGLGHSGEICGAALGMCMVLGLATGYSTGADKETKDAQNARTRALLDDFRGRFGATGCDALREAGNRAVCVAYVRYAAELAERAGGR